MSGFTKQAIQASFLKLLDTYPLRDITVRMITEDCGIKRKSLDRTPGAVHSGTAPGVVITSRSSRGRWRRSSGG